VSLYKTLTESLSAYGLLYKYCYDTCKVRVKNRPKVSDLCLEQCISMFITTTSKCGLGVDIFITVSTMQLRVCCIL